jgi:hypothetical protein
VATQSLALLFREKVLWKELEAMLLPHLFFRKRPQKQHFKRKKMLKYKMHRSTEE